MNRIEPSTLPKTFQDAISITRQLGLKFIWIDSLCIVQDDLDDWTREAASMANIYESAEITIAAAWGSDGSAGCFHDYIRPLSVKVSGGCDFQDKKNPVTVSMCIRPRLDESLFVSRAPLNTRKWVLQERLLSPKTLTFAQDQMHWACPSVKNSEDDLAFVPFSQNNANYRSLHFWESGACPDVDRYLQLHESWELVVADHSSRKLTFAKDKLATLAGVSQAFQRIFGDEPLLGLWRDDLARTLLWETEAAIHSKLDDESISLLNIPSWSWLKINGSVRAVSHYGNGPLLTIDKTLLTWNGLPMIDQISVARVAGRGRILRILDIEQRQGDTCMCYVKEFKVRSAAGGSTELTPYTWTLDKCVEKLPDDISCLIVYDSKVPTRWTLPDDPFMEIRCLLLERSKNALSSVEYMRLGVIMVKDFPRDVFDNTEETRFMLV
jgi:hypothetical protein